MFLLLPQDRQTDRQTDTHTHTHTHTHTEFGKQFSQGRNLVFEGQKTKELKYKLISKPNIILIFEIKQTICRLKHTFVGESILFI
jgi:hypothetical protein